LSIVFEWNTHKAIINVEKHGVCFSEAITIFNDPLAKIFTDVWHSQNEHREIIIGHCRDERLCLVVFTAISDDRYRIISARIATPKEQRCYEQQIR
jgi:uncharacterized protein